MDIGTFGAGVFSGIAADEAFGMIDRPPGQWYNKGMGRR